VIYGKQHRLKTSIDEKLLGYKDMLSEKSLVEIQLGLGNQIRSFRIINRFRHFSHGDPDIYWFQRFTFGTTVDKLRHKISIPLFIVKN
jgi:manganese transport protein